MALVGREGDIQRLWASLARRSVLLSGPRRVGKTELLRTMAAMPHPGWVVLSVDLQGASTTADLVGRWEAAAPAEARATAAGLKAAQGAIHAATGGVSPSVDGWTRLAAATAHVFGGLGSEDRLLVVLDEVPWWLDELDQREGEGAARLALANLRHLRQRWPDRLRLVLTGSVGLAGLAQDLGASAELNDLDRQILDPLTPTWGAALFRQELESGGRQIDDEAAREAAALAGGLPHWIKDIAQRAARQGLGPIGVGHVRLARDEILSPPMRDLFADEAREHFLRRHASDVGPLGAMLDAAAEGEDEPEAALLAVALQAQPGMSERQARSLLYRLVDAWYLRQTSTGRWGFLMPLLRHWWQRYGGFA